MSLMRVGIIFAILLLISHLGIASGNEPKRMPKRELRLERTPSSVDTETTQAHSDKSEITSGATNSTVQASNSVSKNEDEGLTPINEANSVKASKKRGPSVPQSNGGSESTQNLFDDEKGFLAGLDYPELQVVPRASERLQMEAQDEKSSFIGYYWPVQVSALALILAGSTSAGKYREEHPSDAQKAENQFASQMGILFGSLWFGSSYYLGYSLSYGKALPEIKKISGKDKKSLLLKERLSEEALERPVKFTRMINNMSVITTFVLALYISGHSAQTMPSFSGAALGLAFLPWLIDNRIIENWDKHQEYKRKIYAPITGLDFKFDPKSKQMTPLLGLRWNF